ncbi:MAG TPA: hypothetical protein VGF67_11315 [Ktedonobacteraceae bacterium]|jgi:hypothetical protein
MKRRKLKIVVCSLLALSALLVGAFAAGPAQARPHMKSAASVTVSAQRAKAPAATVHTVNVHALPTAHAATGTKAASNRRDMPLLLSPKAVQAKQASGRKAPRTSAVHMPATAASAAATTGFQGMADSATICPFFGGCQPPDMALATSPTLVLEGVNTSYAIYNTSGALVEGPIDDVTWYGVPALPNNCDPAGPFLSDPRAFYDPNSGLFWTATLQVESAAFGVGVDCPTLSKYWVANINMTTGVMHVYSFDMTLGGTVNAGADYTQFGFSASTISFSGNMFDFSTGNYDFDEVQFADKAAMQQGLPVTSTAFTQLAAGNVLVDTVQPVETETTPANDPGVQYLVNSFNINGDPFGDDCFFSACQGFLVWAFDPVSSSLSGTFVGTAVPNPTYVIPPNADEPGCMQCVETIDTRITATPVYSVGGGEGLISFSIDTGVSNGGPLFTNIVPGILWGQIQVVHGTGFVLAGLAQSGYLSFAGDQAASFGAMMQDKNGRLFMVFDSMSASLNPSIMLVSRKAADPLGTIGNTRFIIQGPSATFDSRWGDFEAASYTGFSSNHVWVSSQYSVAGDWNTFIARVS